MMDVEAVRINEALHMLAGKYAEALQQKVLNKGAFQEVLNECVEAAYHQSKISVALSAAKDRISYPNFELEFDYFYNDTQKGFWGIIPALGVEGFATNFARLEDVLQSAVRLEFARKQRLQSVQTIISAIWQEAIELESQQLSLRFPNLKELEALETNNQEDLLPQIAQKIWISAPVVYGQKEILNQLSKALKGQFNRNVLLVGPSGVGKTAMVWEIVRQQQKRKIEGVFWETTASTMIKELTRETGWQDNLAQVCRELSHSQDILFVRNFMELFEVGQYQGNDVSMADYLRPYIGRGEVTLISECSTEEFAQIELRSPNYLSLFHILRIEEPKSELESIIIKKVKDLAKNRTIKIEEEAIRETLRLNRRFTPYAGLPGKPIRFLESILIGQRANNSQNKTNLLDRNTIIQYFCEETGMPLFMVNPEVPMDPTAIKADFNKNVFGQAEAIDSIIDLLASVKTALTKTGKPIASLLFVGPTGVGKTELAKVLAKFMFGSRDKLLRFDMSEFSDPYAVLRLTGLNYNSDGILTSAIRQAPFSVLLFDEIEKAHPNFFDLLLQILSEGRLTDSQGKLVNFCSTIIIMTSNIGAANLHGNRISLQKQSDPTGVTSHFMSAVQQFFRPELYNRIDKIIPFAPLSNEVIHHVVKREIALFKELEGIRHRRLELNLSPAIYPHLAQLGYSPEYGARQLQRTIKEALIIPLAHQLNTYDNEDQLIANIEVMDDKINIQIEADPLGLDLLLEELEKIDYADYASDLRRMICNLEEGKVFVRLLSEIEILERKKKRNPKKFWENQNTSERYSLLLKTQNHLYQLKQQIEAHEIAISTAYMGLSNYDPSVTDQLKEWKKDLFAFKMELYSRMYPKGNQTYLAIYGINTQNIQDIYTQIAKKKGLKWQVKTIWYRESLYKATIPYKAKTDASVHELIKGRFQKKEYAYVDFNVAASAKFTPPEKGDLLCGVIFHFKGDCVQLLLKNEGGLHYWKTTIEAENRIMVQVSSEELSPPDEIHRKDFYKKEANKRIYQVDSLEDKGDKWLIEVSKSDFVPPLLEQLNKQFEAHLNTEVF
jgi:ATP-dependent Clp protease ATP-binding subunit ClpA